LRFPVVRELLQMLRKAESPVLNELQNRISLHLDLSHAAAMLGKWPASRSNIHRAEQAIQQPNPTQSLFEETRVRELQLEVQRLKEFLSAEQDLSRPAPDLNSFLRKVFIFSSRLDESSEGAEVEREAVISQLTSKLLQTMGLDELISRGVTTQQELTRQLGKYFCKSSRLRWKRVFQSKKRKRDVKTTDRCPTKLEICSGNGDWVAAQAKAEGSEANWVALELRHDRVYSTFSRMVLGGLQNLCVIGGDAAIVLKKHIKEESVAQICINFPEPPHWSGNEAAESKLHLLTADFFRHVHNVLEDDGGLTIFSDNYPYCQLLANTLGALEDRGVALFKNVEGIPNAATAENIQNVLLHNGIPSKKIGHAANVTSYFDRFWEHGQHTDRYFLALKKVLGERHGPQ